MKKPLAAETLDNPQLLKRIKFAEQFARLVVIMCISSSTYYFFGLGYSELSISIGGASILYFGILYFLQKANFTFLRYLICLTTASLICITTYCFSAETLSHLFFFPLSICTLVMFSVTERRHILFLLVVNLSAFVYFQFFVQETTQPLFVFLDGDMPLIKSFSVTIALLFTIYAAYLISKLSEEAETELMKSAQFKDRINNLLVHDLRSPVSNAHTLLELLANAKDQEERNTYEAMLKVTNNNMEQLITNILELSRMESVDTTKRNKVNLGIFLEECLSQQENYLSLRKVKLNRNYTQLPVFALFDEKSFRHVIDNLLTNAIKFSHDEGKIEVGFMESGNKALLWVRDHGIGIGEEEQSMIFEKFSAGRVGNRGEVSTGLGMYIAKYITELSSGKIWIESVEGRGTKVNIELQTA
ncbi:MAG: HAMP domain-containing histidine kinase [Flavobacteriaceae bacterium]|nr:HAMP domain-containing histidine kinase [Flavobacteriaceae bacterium]